MEPNLRAHVEWFRLINMSELADCFPILSSDEGVCHSEKLGGSKSESKSESESESEFGSKSESFALRLDANKVRVRAKD